MPGYPDRVKEGGAGPETCRKANCCARIAAQILPQLFDPTHQMCWPHAGHVGIKSMKFSIGRTAFAGRTGRRPGGEPDTLQRIDVFASRGDADNATDKERRARVLQLLYCRHAAEGEEIVYRNALPPADWMNAQLEAQGETWRVVGTSGTTCDIRELETAQLV
jgi:hypothetical protein